MTIRARLSLWYAAVLTVSLLIIGVGTYRQLLEQLDHDHSRRPVRRALRETGELVIPVGLPAVLLGLAGGWWITRRALAPVAALTEAAERITDRNLGTQLPRSGNGDELDRLSDVLNAMTRRLSDSFARIREFTLHASHELKTPLTVMWGETEMELRDPSLTPGQHERAASQLEELRRLAAIVDGLTLLAKADAGLVPLTFASVRMDELVNECFADTQILAAPAGLEVKLASCEPLPVHGDRHRLRQLLLNLADNAVKYNQPGGRIALSLARADGMAEFVITNSGPGISPEVLPRVFDRFFREDAAHSNTVEGCGLGLSIAQWIVGSHQGTIRIESEPSNLTTVTVRLPIAASSPTTS